MEKKLKIEGKEIREMFVIGMDILFSLRRFKELCDPYDIILSEPDGKDMTDHRRSVSKRQLQAIKFMFMEFPNSETLLNVIYETLKISRTYEEEISLKPGADQDGTSGKNTSDTSDTIYPGEGR